MTSSGEESGSWLVSTDDLVPLGQPLAYVMDAVLDAAPERVVVSVHFYDAQTFGHVRQACNRLAA